MARYFNYFPKTNYTFDYKTKNITEVATNIISRYAFESSLKNNTLSFYDYSIRDSDTPEIIAFKYYGNPERHWIVLMFNDIFDPQYDWPLNYNNFIKYVDSKYSANNYADTANTSISGLSWSQNVSNIHSYYKVVTRKLSNGLGDVIQESLEIDSNTYNNLVLGPSTNITTNNNETVTITVTKQTLTYYDYENNLNESKRSIKLLKKEFVDSVEKEFLRVVNG